MRSEMAGLLAFALVGCVSGGTGGGEGSVPVYNAEDEVPCDYEVMRTIEATCTVASVSRMMNLNTACRKERLLGEAGARAGASAVILPPPESPPRLPVVVEGRPANLTFEGRAVRYLDPTCGT